MYLVFRSMWARLWCKLNTISGRSGTLLPLCKLFEDLLQQCVTKVPGFHAVAHVCVFGVFSLVCSGREAPFTLSLCLAIRLFALTRVVARCAPKVVFHLNSVGIQPLRLAFRWIRFAFVGYLEVDEVRVDPASSVLA